MQTIFLDADVILDLLAKREPRFTDSSQIFLAAQSGKYEAATSAVVFANLFYILRKLKGQKEARATLKKLKTLVRLMVTSEASLEQALDSRFVDFEDAIQYYTALNSGANCLLTRNVKDYKASKLAVMTPTQFLNSSQHH